tara:strand:- start:733 stop:1194 length:462 start_codon:yes stop_codon:yes gene_type:complete
MKSYIFNLLFIGLAFCQNNVSEKFILGDYLFIPLINDNYGADKKIINEIKGNPIDNYTALEYIDSKNLSLDELTEFHLRKLGKTNNVEWVVHGSVFQLNKKNDINQIVDNILKFSEGKKVKSHSWIQGTIYKINSITGEKIYLYENESLFKTN